MPHICIPSVSLRHVKEYRRYSRLSPSSTGERLAYILHLDRRGGGKHTCGVGIYQAGHSRFGTAFPDTGLPSSPAMAASGLVAIQDVHHGSHTPVSCGRARGKRGSTLGGFRRAVDRSARKKTIATLLQTKSQIRTARILRLSADQVRHVMERSVAFGLSLRRSTQSHRHLSIDEKSFHKGHDYVSILSENETGIVLDVVGGRKKENVKQLIDMSLTPMQQKWVQTISMDMWEPYMLAAKEHFPDAMVCHDMFHLVTYLNNAVNDVRKREVRKATELRRTKFLFLKDTANLTDREKVRFETIKGANYEVSKAWRIKEDFRDIMHAANSRASAAALLVMWRNEAVRAGIPEITKVANMFYQHIHGVVNAMALGRNTGRAERLNGDIQELKTIGRGFKDVEHFRTTLLFFHGGLVLHKDFLIC